MKSIFYVGKTLHLFVFNPGSPQCQACQEARTDAEGEAEQSVSTWRDLQVSGTFQELIFVPNEIQDVQFSLQREMPEGCRLGLEFVEGYCRLPADLHVVV